MNRFWTFRIGRIEVVRLLLVRAAKPNDETLLHAAEKGYSNYHRFDYVAMIRLE